MWINEFLIYYRCLTRTNQSRYLPRIATLSNNNDDRKRAAKKPRSWRGKAWWKGTRECVCAGKNGWATTRQRRVQKRIYSEEGVKGSRRGIADCGNFRYPRTSAVLIARPNQRYRVKPTCSAERPANFRDFPPSDREVARRISPPRIYGWSWRLDSYNIPPPPEMMR